MFLHRINPGNWARTLFRWLVGGALHLLGVAVVFTVSWWILLPSSTRSALYEAYHYGLFHERPTELLIHLGLSVCFWALLVIGWHLVRSSVPGRQARVVKARGTVMVETIIVMPVLLLVTLGLVQLTLTNTAGLLTSLAAYHSGRTFSVWYPETDPSNPGNPGRNDVDDQVVREKAQLAAAGAVAPVAPSDFIHEDTSGCETTDSLDARLQALEAVGHEDDAGVDTAGDHSLARAFDQSDFSSRGRTKLRFAHCAVTVDYEPNPNNHTIHTEVEYRQQVAMPLMGPLFGEFDTVGEREGFYITIRRDHETSYQLWHNEHAPGGLFGSP